MLRLPILLALLLPSWAGAAVETFELEGGDRLTGEVVERNDERLVLLHPVLGRLEVPVERIEAKEGPRPGLFGTDFLAAWERKLRVGATGSKGNTENTDVSLALRLAHEDENERWLVNGLYDYGQSGHSTDENDGSIEILRDWLSPERTWFPFAYGVGEYDGFKGWQYRASGYGGLGRDFELSPELQLQLRGGAGAVREWGDSGDLRPEGMVRLDVHWKPAPLHEIRLHTNLFPSLEDFGKFRTESGAEWQIKLDEELGLHLVLGVTNEYESEKTTAREERNDFKYRAALGWDF